MDLSVSPSKFHSHCGFHFVVDWAAVWMGVGFSSCCLWVDYSQAEWLCRAAAWIFIPAVQQDSIIDCSSTRYWGHTLLCCMPLSSLPLQQLSSLPLFSLGLKLENMERSAEAAVSLAAHSFCRTGENIAQTTPPPQALLSTYFHRANTQGMLWFDSSFCFALLFLHSFSYFFDEIFLFQVY